MFYLCQLNELVLYRYDTDKTLIWMRCTRETTLCDKVCQWLAGFLRVLACLSVTCWFFPGTCMFVSDLLVFSGYLHVCQWLAGFLWVLACLSVTCWFSPGTCWFSPGTCKVWRYQRGIQKSDKWIYNDPQNTTVYRKLKIKKLELHLKTGA